MNLKNPFLIATVLGARPQFIKAAALSAELSKNHLKEMIIHTGQHYDKNMSDIFFEEMDLPQIHSHLGVGSGSHGSQTGRMLEGIEQVFIKENPQLVIVFGDTNSTLSGSLAAAKLNIPLVHIEAGLRSFNRNMPEEVNRVLTDHLAQLLFCPNESAVKNLAREGIRQGVHAVGDIMIDSLNTFLPVSEKRKAYRNFDLEPKKYFLLTIHRPLNADHEENLTQILQACNEAPDPVLFPIHPRTVKRAKKILASIKPKNQIIPTEPFGYLDMLSLMSQAKMVVTDSGGMQKEALYLKVPCLTIRPETEWLETLQGGWNHLVEPKRKSLIEMMSLPQPKTPPEHPYGKGQTATKMVSIIKTFIQAL